MLAISSDHRTQKVEELRQLESYVEKAIAIFNVRDNKFSKDTAHAEVKTILQQSPCSTLCSEEVVQITDIIKRFANGKEDELDKDTAACWLISAHQEVAAMREAYENLGSCKIYTITCP